MQPSIQVNQALTRGLKRLREEYALAYTHIKVKSRFHFTPSFREWVVTRKLITVEELAQILVNSQLYSTEFEVLKAALAGVSEVSDGVVTCLSIGADPAQLHKPVIIAALPITP
jgi:hypothetical protein